MIIAKDLSNFNEMVNKFRIRAAATAQQGGTVFLAQSGDFCELLGVHVVLCLSLSIDDGISGIGLA